MQLKQAGWPLKTPPAPPPLSSNSAVKINMCLSPPLQQQDSRFHFHFVFKIVRSAFFSASEKSSVDHRFARSDGSACPCLLSVLYRTGYRVRRGRSSELGEDGWTFTLSFLVVACAVARFRW